MFRRSRSRRLILLLLLAMLAVWPVVGYFLGVWSWTQYAYQFRIGSGQEDASLVKLAPLDSIRILAEFSEKPGIIDIVLVPKESFAKTPYCLGAGALRSKCMGAWTAPMLLVGANGELQCEIDNIDRQLGKGPGCAYSTIDEAGGTWTTTGDHPSTTLELRFTSWKGGDYILLVGGVKGPPATYVPGQATVTVARLSLAAIPAGAFVIVVAYISRRQSRKRGVVPAPYRGPAIGSVRTTEFHGPAPRSVPATRFCMSCGAPAQASATYCTKCGSKQ